MPTNPFEPPKEVGRPAEPLKASHFTMLIWAAAVVTGVAMILAAIVLALWDRVRT